MADAESSTDGASAADLRAVDSVGAPQAERAAAALTLGSRALDRREQERLRVAAESTANPPLRFVFDSVRSAATADEEALAEVHAERAAAGEAGQQRPEPGADEKG